MKNPYEVILKPVISEKAAALAEVAGRYTFVVAPQAHKHEIRDAVEKLFNVKVQRVRTMIVHGQTKRVGRSEIKESNRKKAIITLKPGQKIEMMEGR